MRRSIDQAFLDLRQHITEWATSGARPGIRVFVYRPAWEAAMLARFPIFAQECADAGRPMELHDVGQGFLREIERRSGAIEQLAEVERASRDRLLQDLGRFAERYLLRTLKAPLDSPLVTRILVNSGALGTFVSYSAIANALHDDGQGGDVAAPNILAFPGEGDERSLNLLGLRIDTNYRVPRI